MEHVLTNTGSLILYLFVYSVSALFAVEIIQRNNDGTLVKKQISVVKCILILIGPVLLAAFRNYVGGDFWVYVGYMDRFKNTTWEMWFDDYDYFNGTPLGVFAIAKFAGLFNSTHVFFGFFAVITFLPVVCFLFKDFNECDIPLAIFIFLMTTFSTGFNIMKQTVAITFVLVSIKYVFERKFLKFAILIFIASLFHVTALVAFPLYILWSSIGDIRNTKKAIVLISSLLIVFNMDRLLNFIGGRWEDYDEQEVTSNLSFLLVLFWLLVFLVFYRRLAQISEKNKCLIIMYAIGTVLYLVGFWGVFAKRIADYYTIPRFILMAQLPSCFDKKSTQFIVKLGLLIYTVFMFVYTYMIRGQVGIFPYGYIY